MKTKIEIGNFARRKTDGKIVEKVISEDGWVSYLEDRKITGCCTMEEIDAVDAKTAFLTRLQELLATFDVCIDSSYSDKYCCDYPCIHINGEELYYFDGIFAENVFDYDKD